MGFSSALDGVPVTVKNSASGDRRIERYKVNIVFPAHYDPPFSPHRISRAVYLFLQHSLALPLNFCLPCLRTSRRAAAGRAQLLAKREGILGACKDSEKFSLFSAYVARPPAVGCYPKARPPAVGCYRAATAALCLVWHGPPLSAVT